MPLRTRASAVSRTVRSSIPQPKWFQELQPIGGVRASPPEVAAADAGSAKATAAIASAIRALSFDQNPAQQLAGGRLLHQIHQGLHRPERQGPSRLVGEGDRRQAQVLGEGRAHAGHEHAPAHVHEELATTVAIHDLPPGALRRWKTIGPSSRARPNPNLEFVEPSAEIVSD